MSNDKSRKVLRATLWTIGIVLVLTFLIFAAPNCGPVDPADRPYQLFP